MLPCRAKNSSSTFSISTIHSLQLQLLQHKIRKATTEKAAEEMDKKKGRGKRGKSMGDDTAAAAAAAEPEGEKEVGAVPKTKKLARNHKNRKSLGER